MLMLAPISNPPALRPSMQRRRGLVYFWSIRNEAQAMKSVIVLRLFRNLPFSYQLLPISPAERRNHTTCELYNI